MTTRARSGPVALGGRLRAQREKHGLSLRELARRIEVSPSLISQIENGKVQPSVSTLYRIMTELGESLDRLLLDDHAPAVAAVGHAPARPPAPAVQRRDGRAVIEFGSGVRWERLTTQPVPGIDFLYVTYAPGAQSTPAGSRQRHPGREWGYVDAGRLHVAVGHEEHVIGPGDAICFDSTVPHRLWNPGPDTVHGVWFVLGRNGGHG